MNDLIPLGSRFCIQFVQDTTETYIQRVDDKGFIDKIVTYKNPRLAVIHLSWIISSIDSEIFNFVRRTEIGSPGFDGSVIKYEYESIKNIPFSKTSE